MSKLLETVWSSCILLCWVGLMLLHCWGKARLCTCPQALLIMRFSSLAGWIATIHGPVWSPLIAHCHPFECFWLRRFLRMCTVTATVLNTWRAHLLGQLSYLLLCPKNSSLLALHRLLALTQFSKLQALVWIFSSCVQVPGIQLEQFQDTSFSPPVSLTALHFVAWCPVSWEPLFPVFIILVI